MGELLRLVGAVEYALLSKDRIESIVEAFEALLICMACRRGSYVGELGVGEVCFSLTV
jgi:hypothetical protein